MEPTIASVVSYKKYVVGGILLLIIASGVYVYQSHLIEEPVIVEKHQETPATTSVVTSVATTTAPTITATTSAVSKYKHNDGISDEERSLVIESKVRMYEILSSKDLTKIRAYISEGAKASGDKKQIEDINNISDKDLSFFVDLIVNFAFVNIKNAQDLRDILLSDKTVWTKDIKNGFEHVTMVIDIDETDEHTTLEAFKFGKVWY